MNAFFALSTRQKGWFLEAWWRFLLWHFRIRYQTYHRWQGRVFARNTNTNGGNNIKQQAPASDSVIDIEQAKAIARIIEKASRHHFTKMNCLRRCMVAMDMLGSRHLFCTLHIGVQKQPDGPLKAHCWVTLNDFLVNDSEEEVAKYTELKTQSDTAVMHILQRQPN